MGRTNKLVDGCYSFWQGGIFPLLQRLNPAHLAQTRVPRGPPRPAPDPEGDNEPSHPQGDAPPEGFSAKGWNEGGAVQSSQGDTEQKGLTASRSIVVLPPPEGLAVGPTAAAGLKAEAAKAAADQAVEAAISMQGSRGDNSRGSRGAHTGSGTSSDSSNSGGHSIQDRLSAQRIRQIVDAAGAVVEVITSHQLNLLALQRSLGAFLRQFMS